MTKTRHRNITKKNKATRKKSGKKWTTEIYVAQKTLSKGSLSATQGSFRKKSKLNARKLFG